MKKRRKYTILAASAVAVLLVWFLGVDRSWFVEDCPSCGFSRDILQFRIFSIPVHERVWEHTTLIQRVAQDLDTACAHPKFERWHKCRWWGLCICAYPRISGIYRIGGDMSWYDGAAAGRAKKLAEANPSLRDEFAKRVLQERDMGYWKTFCEQLKKESRN